MESTSEISRLCETWWGKLADTAKPDQHRFAEQLLALLGWQNTEGGKSGLVIPFPSAASAGGSPALPHFSYILRGQGQSSVAAHFVMPGVLEPPSLVTQGALDFCEATRLLVRETAALHVDYAFITDLYRAYLYDARTEELLLTANTPAEFRRDLAAILSRAEVERGALEEIRRHPRSHTARQFREWRHRWGETLSSDCALDRESASLLLDRVLVLRYLANHDILKRPGSRIRDRFWDMLAGALRADVNCCRQLRGLFDEMWTEYACDLFAPAAAVDAALQHEAVVARLLKELALHAAGKFNVATILESFNYGDAAEKARVRMVPDLNEEREQYLSRRTLEDVDDARLEIDLSDEGYRAVFYWFDQLVALYKRLETAYGNQAFAAAGPQEEMDLFTWSEMASKRPQALSDKFLYAVEKGLTIYHATPRQYRTGRLMLLLHLIDQYARAGGRMPRFPRMDATFKLRPRVLENDRKWIFQERGAREEW